MSDQEKESAPETVAAPTTSDAVQSAGADVAIAESNGPNTTNPGAPVSVGRPPIAAILGAVLAVIVVVMLWVIAGNVKLQACVAQAEAQYGSNTDPKSLATLGRKNAVLRCSDSPF